jgi:hypothetical protein
MAWHSQSLTLLRTYFGSSHACVQSLETATTFGEGPYAAPAYVQSGIGVLQAATEDISKGWTWTFKERVHAVLFEDFLEMADSLLGDGYKDAAVMIAGGVLEEHLRKLCQKNGIAAEKPGGRKPEPKTLAAMNDQLRNHGTYNQAEWRSVQVWIDNRNDAAHRHYENYDQKQIKRTIEGIRGFHYPSPCLIVKTS